MNYNNIYRIFILVSLLITSVSIYGQQNDDLDIADVVESIKLNTDRDLYLCGEDIFFNADYFINGEKTYPVLSNVLYLELIECENSKSIFQKKLEIVDFNVNGIISIPQDIVPGNYLLRVYTRYQRNFSALNFSSRFLTILNPNSSKSINSNSTEVDSISIVAEGKILLNGIKNKVVIKIPKYLLDKDNKYFVTDENNKIYKEIYLLNKGLIQTEMIFNDSNKYKLCIIKNSGDTLFKQFPKIQDKGIQTNVIASANNIYYKVKVKDDNKNLLRSNYKLKLYSNEYSLQYSKNVSIDNSFFDINIPSNVLNNGINYIVLLDENENIVRINSVYKLFSQFNKIDIKVNKDKFSTKEEISLSLSAENKEKQEFPIVSVSVIRHGTKSEAGNFLPYSYLKYPVLIENFLEESKINSELHEQIMILFDKEIDVRTFDNRIKKSKNKELKYIPEVRDVTISGILRNKKTQNPIPNHNIYLSVLFNSNQIHIYKTRENGEFVFSLNNVYGKKDLFLCSETYDKEDEEHELLIEKSFSSDIPPFSSMPLFVGSAEEDLVREMYINAQIQERFCKIQENKIEKQSNDLQFNLNDNKKTILLENYVKLESMQELFYELVPSVLVKKSKNQYYFEVLGENDYILRGKPLVLLDNVIIFDPNKIMKLKPSIIEKIEVINKTYILGSNTMNGIIMLSTNTDDFGGIKMPKSATFIEFQTIEKLSSNVIFDGCIPDSLSRIPDFRTTLYWNPKVKLTNNGQDIHFNASDRKGIYDVVIQGYMSNGKIYYGKKQISIY